jgi:hypothetical protein
VCWSSGRHQISQADFSSLRRSAFPPCEFFFPVNLSCCGHWLCAQINSGHPVQWSQPRFFVLPLYFSGNLISVRKACIFSVGARLPVKSGVFLPAVFLCVNFHHQFCVLGHGSSFPSLICLSVPVLFVHPAATVSLLAGNFQDPAKGLAQDPF